MPKVAQQGAPASQTHDDLNEAGIQQDPVVQPDETAEQDDSARQDDGAPQDDSARQGDSARAGAGAGEAGDQSPAEQADTEDVAPARALPKRVPGQQPVISGFDSKPATAVASQEPPTEPNSSASDDDTDASAFNAAPTADEDEEADGLPALRRTRSSPTPPKDT